jgi:hypothetical protein
MPFALAHRETVILTLEDAEDYRCSKQWRASGRSVKDEAKLQPPSCMQGGTLNVVSSLRRRGSHRDNRFVDPIAALLALQSDNFVA